ncbi:uncharacterized protein LOC120283005 [Dioscorea cayenensis subsp. rotundata]|uniref:Uncharacterized protein LOC120283005 n=1 Tax=Dioscorea cayennensis subsp. rotundata TaxID=55577 RepID=A0AB40D287_DIOCR|nr:uncharacterized protein LOC120283005 [Dioscorea cayenensis subsp. rotundata]
MIMSWLWNSMQPSISKIFMFLPTNHDIWESARKTYSKMKDAAVLYEIKTKITNTKQGTLSVTEYYNLMNGLWLELDNYQNLTMKCNDDTQTLLKLLEEERIFQFLAGLNIEFDQVRVQQLGKEETPSLEEVYSAIKAEENRRTVMLETQPAIGSAMISTKPNHSRGHTPRQTEGKPEVYKSSNRDGLWCNYCKKARHTKDTCFKLHGKEQVFNKIKHQRTQALCAVQEDRQKSTNEGQFSKLRFNQEEIDKLKGFLNTLPLGCVFVSDNR